jgi:carbamoyl-phosphate synthase large subunit
MGVDESFGMAFAKSQMAVGFKVPLAGRVFVSVHNDHKERIVPVIRKFHEMGFTIVATRGTATYLYEQGIPLETILKVSEGLPHVVDRIKNGDIQIIINTSVGRKSSRDAYHIRRGALVYNILYTTTLSGARALSEAVMALKQKEWTVTPLQDYHQAMRDKGKL